MKKPDLHTINGDDIERPCDGLSVCLITALTVADFIDPDLIADAHANTGAQLGVLTLAALLRAQGFKPIVVNLDDLFFDFVRRDKSRPSLKGKAPNDLSSRRGAPG